MSSSTELGINISALAGLTNTQGCICRFSSLYRSHTFVHHNRSNHSPLLQMLQSLILLLFPHVNALLRRKSAGKPKLANIHYYLFAI